MGPVGAFPRLCLRREAGSPSLPVVLPCVWDLRSLVLSTARGDGGLGRALLAQGIAGVQGRCCCSSRGQRGPGGGAEPASLPAGCACGPQLSPTREVTQPEN